MLPNGNFVVTDPGWDNFKGAVYLYDGATHAQISVLTGTTEGDSLGFGGITVLTTGNYVVSSPGWNHELGAATWCDQTTGLTAEVSAANSWTGATPGDRVSSGGITALKNGDYVISSMAWSANRGAVTWGNGAGGSVGVVSTANSLTGSHANDRIGSSGIQALSGNAYVVNSPSWNEGRGAVTRGSGMLAASVAASNSLTGGAAGDSVGSGGVTLLTNGNYVVGSPRWDNATIPDAGAATFGGSSGVQGSVTDLNSLVGSNSSDRVGSFVKALPNGNYVVSSPGWDHGTATNAGAVTFGDGTAGISGVISNLNSLTGTADNDSVGGGGITVLSNGNYVVSSPLWNNSAIENAGAATWGSISSGIAGNVYADNSLVGHIADDSVSNGGILALTNGHYVVSSPRWNGAIYQLGAVTWGNGNSGVSGTITALNSIVGTQNGRTISSGGMVALTNGNYIFLSPLWDNDGINQAGAITWVKGNSVATGVVSVDNSLVGDVAFGKMGNTGAVALSNGNYVVPNHLWGPTETSFYGAVTWGNGATGTFGVISEANSLVGTQTGDQVGSGVLGENATPGVVALPNGNYVVASPYWDRGAVANTGAVTWRDGTQPATGTISQDNSLVGQNTGDQLGSGQVIPFPNSNYAIKNPLWANGSASNAGAIAFGEGISYTSGSINDCNSILGEVTDAGYSLMPVYNPTEKYLLVGKPAEKKVAIHRVVSNSLAGNAAQDNRAVAAEPVRFGTLCAPIARIAAAGDNPVSGTVNARVFVAPVTPQLYGMHYVRRHYDITPETNPETATANVTLFFTQQDFDFYNAAVSSTLHLPTDPADETGKANIRITQHHGTSETGLPGSYTGWTGEDPIVLLTPTDVTWNATRERWEVTVPVTGFSGFFAHGNNGIALPVKLIDFIAQRTATPANMLQWHTATEDDGAAFAVTRSSDGRLFETIGYVSGKGSNSRYTFYDEHPVNGLNHYRLRITDYSGEVAYSRVVMLSNTKNVGAVRIAPVPAGKELRIQNTNATLNGHIAIVFDVQGREVARFALLASQTLDISHWPIGIYSLHLPDGSVQKLVKQ